MAGIGKEFATAFLSAQKEMENPPKDHTAKIPTKSGGSFSYSYAGLESVVACAKAALLSHDISVAQPPVTTEAGLVGIKTELIYKSGEVWDRGTLVMKVSDDPQKIGSALTYLRRYGLTSAVGMVAEDDDDGQGAQGKAKKKPPKKPAENKAPPVENSKARTPEEHLASIEGHFKMFTDAFGADRASVELVNVTEFEKKDDKGKPTGEMVGAIADIKTFVEKVSASTDQKRKALRLRIVCHEIEAAYKKALSVEKT